MSLRDTTNKHNFGSDSPLLEDLSTLGIRPRISAGGPYGLQGEINKFSEGKRVFCWH